MFGKILNIHGRDEKSTLHIVPYSREVIPRRDFLVSINKTQAKLRQTLKEHYMAGSTVFLY